MMVPYITFLKSKPVKGTLVALCRRSSESQVTGTMDGRKSIVLFFGLLSLVWVAPPLPIS